MCIRGACRAHWSCRTRSRRPATVLDRERVFGSGIVPSITDSPTWSQARDVEGSLAVSGMPCSGPQLAPARAASAARARFRACSICQTTIAFSSGLMAFGEGVSMGGTLVTASGWNSHALLVRKILSNQNTQSGVELSPALEDGYG